MKQKFLLLVVAMLIIYFPTVIAQALPVKQHSVKDIIPFGKKLPLADPADFRGRAFSMPDQYRKDMLPGLLNTNTARKDPAYYRQQIQNLRDAQTRIADRKGLYTPIEDNRGGSRSGFHLTRDINALAESNPTNYKDPYSPDNSYAVLNGNIYFAADDGIHGTELWKSDGTANGTVMVKDIESGEISTYITNITAVNGKLYFSAATANYGLEPWISDGTETGTRLLKDIKPGWSFATEYTALGNTVYFVTDGDFAYYGSLWKTDGTTEGTILVKNLGETGDGGFGIFQPVVSNGLLFFSFFSNATGGSELWRSDGTDAGTFHIGPPASSPTQLTNYHNRLYFSQNDGTGNKLWVSDGTESGTTYAPHNNNILIDNIYFGTNFPILNNVLYMAGHTGSAANGLYKYDPANTAGTVLVKDFSTGADPNVIVSNEMRVVNERLYFKVSHGGANVHDELWNSNGSEATTKLVEKFATNEWISTLFNGNGTLYFVKHDPVYGTELWKTNPTATNTILVSDIFKGTASSSPNYLTSFKGRLFFSAADENKGLELYSTFGYDFLTYIVRDINTVSTSNANIGPMASLGNKVIFTAYERVRGNALYTSDGTKSGTDLLHDIPAGENGVYPSLLLSKNNAVYFALAIFDETPTSAVYRTRGEKQSLQKITPDVDALQSIIGSFDVADNGLVFYVVFNYITGARELWRSNGTNAGTFLLSSTLYFYEYLNVVGNLAFFVAGDDVNGYELWKSDGSIPGTKMIKDINPGLADAAPGGLFEFNKAVYFGAYDGTSSNYSFWKSDGTEGGTIKLKDIDPTWGFDVNSTGEFFAPLNGILYFNANDHADKGIELWKTNGSPEGTQLVKDIYPGEFSSFPIRLKTANDLLFFNADDGEHGIELWKSNGTEAGTQLVKDLAPGPDPGYVSNPADVDGGLLFTLSTFTGYAGLWLTDGTPDGTKEISKDVVGDVQISAIFPAKNNLFFAGYNYKYGTELYAGKVTANKTTTESGRPITEILSNETPTFNAILYPNPSTSNTSLQLTGDTRQVSVTLSDINGKKLWQSGTIGKSLLTLPTGKLNTGIYLVTIRNGAESKTIKLVKH